MKQRLIGLDEAISKFSVDLPGVYTSFEIKRVLEEALTIDPVHAAGGCYCRECKNWDRRKTLWIEMGTCRRNGADFAEHGFCSYGERKDSEGLK